MTARGFAALALTGAALALSACATPEPPASVSPATPPSTAPQVVPPGPAAAGPLAPSTKTSKPATAALKSPHRQYLDQRTGRYYYFDQTAHRYFWEDGTPRY